MNLSEADNIARLLVAEHLGSPWRVAWNNRKTVMGVCDHAHMVIGLSRPFFRINGEAELRDTVLHEIAHAIVGHGHGHDAAWRSKARTLGATPQRCGYPENEPQALWTATCPNGHEVKRHRLAKDYQTGSRVASCNTCAPGRFDHRFVFVWKKSG